MKDELLIMALKLVVIVMGEIREEITTKENETSPRMESIKIGVKHLLGIANEIEKENTSNLDVN